jgi:1,4-alpha-glucan branching enzyme
MKKSNRRAEKNVTFQFITDPGKDVFIAGTFNAWQPGKTRLTENSAGEYSVTLQLPGGRHEYKFVVDDVWHTDPLNPETIPNDCGSMNSVIVVA